jgi:hypothetical protein
MTIAKNRTYLKDKQVITLQSSANNPHKHNGFGRLLTLFFLMFFPFMSSFCQDLPPIQLDRPDQTECSYITPLRYIQIENGFSIENVDDEHQILTYPSSLWKYGVNEKLELRLVTEVVAEKNNGTISNGILPITVGFKVALSEEKGILPKTSFIGHLTTSKLGSVVYRTTYFLPAFRFTMQHTLSKKIGLAYNLGAEWKGETGEPTYINTLTTGLSLTEKLGCYAEIYGFIPSHSQADHRLDAGFTYLITNNLITDISGGVGITPNAQKNYLAFGISYRFKTSKE